MSWPLIRCRCGCCSASAASSSASSSGRPRRSSASARSSTAASRASSRWRRAVEPAAAGGLRLVWSYGLIAATDERPVDAPLGEIPEEGHEARTMTGLDTEWANLDEFIAYVRR
jgi:hypothetical protein